MTFKKRRKSLVKLFQGCLAIKRTFHWGKFIHFLKVSIQEVLVEIVRGHRKKPVSKFLLYLGIQAIARRVRSQMALDWFLRLAHSIGAGHPTILGVAQELGHRTHLLYHILFQVVALFQIITKYFFLFQGVLAAFFWLEKPLGHIASAKSQGV